MSMCKMAKGGVVKMKKGGKVAESKAWAKRTFDTYPALMQILPQVSVKILITQKAQKVKRKRRKHNGRT